MDPFKEVLADAEDQLERVRRLLFKYTENAAANTLADIQNQMQELTETVHDLSQSIATAQQNPSVFGLEEHEIERRIQQVGHINSQVNGVQEQLSDARKAAHNAAETAEMQQLSAKNDETIDDSARDAILEQTLADQDDILDSVFHTVTALREQANVMSRELEDQAEMLDDFDRAADNAGDRLRQGLKRVDYVLKHNRETLSSCCITLLIIALVVLLVLVLIV